MNVTNMKFCTDCNVVVTHLSTDITLLDISLQFYLEHGARLTSRILKLDVQRQPGFILTPVSEEKLVAVPHRHSKSTVRQSSARL